MRRLLFPLLLLFLSTTVFAQNDQIAPTLTGEELIDYLQENYSVTNPKGYDSARDAMYGNIDNHDGQVTGVYTGYTITTNNRTDAYNKGINTEHTWPQGLFDSNEPMRGDIHHLFPTVIDVNGDRSNYPFDEIPDSQTDRWYRLLTETTSIPTSNIDEYSELDSGRAFEPREDHKGNVARAIFYFWTIYQDRSNVADDASFFNGMKDVLYTWHYADPVDDAEVARSLATEQVQGNKNPFVHDTSLVRRAYFGGGAIQQDEVPNPVIGEIISINNPVFSLEYVEEGSLKSVNFLFTNDMATEDTAGNAFTFTDYSAIYKAEVVWEAGSTSDEYIATSVKVIQFNENDDDTVITGPTATSTGLILTGVVDGPLDGGLPKAIELYATEDIPDLSVFALGAANNGGGSDGVEFVLEGSAAAGSYIYVTTDFSAFNTFFGFEADLEDTYEADNMAAAAVNGDDAIELFYDSTKSFSEPLSVIDVFGDINTDGSGTTWDYEDGWAYRVDYTGPDSTVFNESNWVFSGSNALDGETSNSTAAQPFPAGTFKYSGGTSVVEEMDAPSNISLEQNYPNPFNPQTTIRFNLDMPGKVSLSVYNLLGQKVAVLANEVFSAGTHQRTFNAANFPSGVYMYRLEFNGVQLTRKMTLLK